jgi:TonB family protein
VTARVVVASAALHVLVLIVLVVAATRAPRPATVDIELVAPAVAVVPPLPPPLDRGRDAGQRGDRIADRAPGRRSEPIRTVSHPRRAAPLLPSLPAALPDAPDLPAEPAAAPSADVTAGEPAAGDDPTSGGGTGEGDGGRGRGDGAPDLSARPIPLDANPSRTLPYTAEAQRDQVSGDVHLVLTVDSLGRVGRATVRHGLGHGLDEIATRLALQIRFRPARDREGNATAGTVRWRFHFQPP